jgi:hypothetical protein
MRYDLDDLHEAALEAGIDLDWLQWDGGPELGQILQHPGDWYPGATDEPPPPQSDYGSWVQTQGDIPKEETPGSGWPAAVPIRPANWNMDTDPDSYKIAWGDTLAGLSATYLGTPMRWKEIWDQQPDSYRWSHSPDKLMPGQWIFMPPDASATLRAALGQPPEPGDKPAPPPPGGYPAPAGPVTPPGEAPTAKKKKKSILPWVVGGGALAALAAYAMS